MAQFVEVMKQARRLCETQQGIECCVRCPMQGKDGCMVVADVENIDYVEAERKIMDWAAEHPEPVYPSWIDAWKQLFPGANNVPCPELYFGAECTDGSGEGCIVCERSPIPAEVAKKLGIRPIEIKKPVSCRTCKYSDKSVWQAPCLACKRAHGDCYPDQREEEEDA